MNSATTSKKTYILVWASLMVLLALTWGVAEFDLGIINSVAVVAIALLKMFLVILFFMHVRYNSRLTWIFVGAGFVWFLIMVTLTMTDYLSRGWVRPTNRTISYWRDGVPPAPPGDYPGGVTPDGNR